MADAVGGATPKVNGHSNGFPSAYAAKYNLAPHFIGGNALPKAPPSKVKDFVAAHDGHTVITNVSTKRRWWDEQLKELRLGWAIRTVPFLGQARELTFHPGINRE